MESQKLFSSSGLKIIAIISMFIDHFAASYAFQNMYYYFKPSGTHYDIYYESMRIIGRLAFPIFCFLIANGYFYSKNPLHYFYRLSAFAIISEIPFDLAFQQSWLDFSYQNVFFTLTLGLLAIILYDYFKDKEIYLSIISVFTLAILAYILKTDYGAWGVMMIFSFYFFKKNKLGMFLSVFAICFLMVLPSLINTIIIYLQGGYIDYRYLDVEIFAVFAFIFIFNYNHKKGLNMKYFFYIFYPAHLLLFVFIRELFQ